MLSRLRLHDRAEFDTGERGAEFDEAAGVVASAGHRPGRGFDGVGVDGVDSDRVAGVGERHGERRFSQSVGGDQCGFLQPETAGGFEERGDGRVSMGSAPLRTKRRLDRS